MLKPIQNLPEALRAREMALRWLVEVSLRDETLESATTHLALEELTPQDRAFAQRLTTSVLRQEKPFGQLLKAFLRKALREKDVPVQLILLLGMAQMLREDIPAHAAVHSSVELCKLHGYERKAGLVNAVLKQVADQKDTLNEKLDAMPPKEWLPSWLFDDWRGYGKEAMAGIKDGLRSQPPLDLCVKKNAAGWAEKLGGEAVGSHTVRLASGGAAVSQLEGYARGDWWVQDVAASLPAQLLLDHLGGGKGKTIFDLCAAPGGKAMQLANAGAHVVAVDASAHRLQRMEENLQRTRLHEQVEMIRADLRDWHPAGMPDAILLDAPCTATGTFRKHPDVLKKRPKDVKEMAALQRELLSQLMAWLPSGVPVMYCVCSLQKEEGEAQMEWLLETFPQARAMKLTLPAHMPKECLTESGAIRTSPHQLEGGMDGFFMATFEKE